MAKISGAGEPTGSSITLGKPGMGVDHWDDTAGGYEYIGSGGIRIGDGDSDTVTPVYHFQIPRLGEISRLTIRIDGDEHNAFGGGTEVYVNTAFQAIFDSATTSITLSTESDVDSWISGEGDADSLGDYLDVRLVNDGWDDMEIFDLAITVQYEDVSDARLLGAYQSIYDAYTILDTYHREISPELSPLADADTMVAEGVQKALGVADALSHLNGLSISSLNVGDWGSWITTAQDIRSSISSVWNVWSSLYDLIMSIPDAFDDFLVALAAQDDANSIANGVESSRNAMLALGQGFQSYAADGQITANERTLLDAKIVSANSWLLGLESVINGYAWELDGSGAAADTIESYLSIVEPLADYSFVGGDPVRDSCLVDDYQQFLTLLRSDLQDWVVNSAPTDVALSNSTVLENQATGTVVGTFSTTDPNSGDTFTYTLVNGGGSGDNGSFSVVGNTLRTAASFNYETKNSYSIRVRTTDQGGLPYEEAFTINVTNVNEQPTDISLSNSMVAENEPVGAVVGTFSTTDPDIGNTFTYTLVNGGGSGDNGSFSVVGNTLRTAASFNYETKNSYSIRVRTTDQGGLPYEEAFTINVTNVNEQPTDISLSNSMVAENEPVGAVVGTFSTTDPDSGDTFTYTLVSGSGGADNTSFDISGNQLKTAESFNYEARDSYSIRVCSTDQGGLSTEKVFAITVTDVNEAPSNILLSGMDVDENASNGTPIGTLSGTDPDGDELAFRLIDNAGGRFVIINDNELVVANGSLLDYESDTSHDITVEVSDGELTRSEVFTISVNMEAVAQPLSYFQDFSAGIPGAGEGWEYYSSGEGRIEVADGQLRLDDSTDGGEYSLNEAILHLNLSGATGLLLEFDCDESGDEVHHDGLAVGDTFTGPHRNADLVAISDDGGATWNVIYLLDVDEHVVVDLDAAIADAGMTYGPNFLVKFQQYDNYAWPTDGWAFDNIHVYSNQPPTDIALSNSTVLENAAGGTVVGTLSGSDPENDSLVFRLVDSAGRRFRIDGTELIAVGSDVAEVVQFKTVGGGGTRYTRFEEGPYVVKLSDAQYQAARATGYLNNDAFANNFPRGDWPYTPDPDGVYWLCFEADGNDWDYKDAMIRVTANVDGTTTLLITAGATGYLNSLVDLIDGSEVAPIPSSTPGTEISLPAPNLLDYESAASHDITVEVSDGEHTYSEVFTINVTDIPDAGIVAHHVFYNNSDWDGNDPAAGAGDDAAIATDKFALLPGGTAAFANYTSYSRGINGIMIDIAALANPGGLTDADFVFKVGNDDDPGSWAAAPAPVNDIAADVRLGAGVDGSDRVTIIWADNAIEKQWLQVTVLDTVNTGLPEADVFYFGNMPGDATGNGATNGFDLLRVRQNYLMPPGEGRDDTADVTMDGNVNGFDLLAVRQNYLQSIPMISTPAAAAAGMAALTGPAVAPVEAIVAAPISTQIAPAVEQVRVETISAASETATIIRAVFNRNVSAVPAALEITAASGLQVDLSTSAFRYEPVTRTASWTIPSLAEGYYEGVIRASAVASDNGSPTRDYGFHFRLLDGIIEDLQQDTNGDGVVDLLDLIAV